MAKFEVISKYADAGLTEPVRKTKYSAGYDLCAAEDIIIPSNFLDEIITLLPFPKTKYLTFMQGIQHKPKILSIITNA